MTTPAAMTSAVLDTRTYLVKQAQRGDEDAKRLLKDFPNAVDVAFASETFDRDEVDRWIADWSLPSAPA